MMVNEAVCVFCRLKPLIEENVEPCIKYENQYTVCTVPPMGCRRNTKEMTYNFTKVFHDNTTQSEIYNDVAYPLVNDLLNSKNGLLFAYGVTGSGKTYTMEGTRENPGIVPRTIKSLFRRLKFINRFCIEPNNRNGYSVVFSPDSTNPVFENVTDYTRRSKNFAHRDYMRKIEDDPFDEYLVDNCTVFISMVEIYGNNIKDLLSTKTEINMKIREDNKNNNYIYNVKEMEVQEPEDAINWYLEGQKKRKTAQTNLNNESSRSHCVFNIRLVKLDRKKPRNYISPDKNFDKHVTFSQLSLVDLAGSERAKRTGATGVQLKEAGDINNSLMELQKIMKKLRENQKCSANNQYIDYRSSELTRLFKTNFEDGSSVRMVLCVQPLPEEYDETLRVMTFAEETREIRIQLHDNLYTPKVPRMPVKPIIAEKENDPLFELLSKLEEEMNAEIPNVERYRMVQQSELNDDQEMMNNILIILDTMNKIIHYKDKMNSAILSHLEMDDQSEMVESLNSKLNSSNLQINSLKRRLRDAESKLADKDRELANKDLEMTNLNKLNVKNADKIKELKDKAKRDKDEWEQQWKMRNLNDLLNRNSNANTPVASVKTLTKKFEDVSNNQKVMSEISRKRAPLAPVNNKKGFFNRHYRHSKSHGQYFEHKEKNEIPAGTLNKLDIKKRRSSKKLKLENLQKADKYILQHQSVTADQFRVDYHSGDVIPTAGGGVAVCLTRVETIKQHSPYQHTYVRKRQSSVPSDISENYKRSKDNY